MKIREIQKSLSIIADNSGKKILIIGDIMLDCYYVGTVKRISPEAPVPVYAFSSKSYDLGGCGNVAQNVASSGLSASVLTAFGSDEDGGRIQKLLKKTGVDYSLSVIVDKYRSTSKIRITDPSGNQLLRIDREEPLVLQEPVKHQILNELALSIKNFDVVLLSDYNKGFLDKDLSLKIIDLANKEGVKILCDVKGTDPEKYQNAYLLKPNFAELCGMTGIANKDDASLIKGLKSLKDRTNSKEVLVTLGGGGIAFLKGGVLQKSASFKVDVFNVSGAGDTVNAYLGVSLASGLTLEQSIDVANFAAAIKVTKKRTSPVALFEMYDKCSVLGIRDPSDKIVKISAGFLSMLKNKKIVFTNGCFDLVHLGHLKMLQDAKRMGDILIVGLNSDASVKRLKGSSRPINDQSSRAYLLACLSFVDYVVIFDDDTPLALIQQIKPSVLVKGGDYQVSAIVGADFVKGYGGKVRVVRTVEGYSTTNLIRRIKQ